MSAAADASPQSEYIQHHLVHFNSSGHKQDLIAQFDIINYDSIFWSSAMGLIAVFVMWLAARRATAGVPGRLQGAIEMLVDMVDQQARSIISSPATRKFAAPLALTVFVWIILMNALDLVPVDLPSVIIHALGFGHEPTDPLYYHRILPTADLNIPMGMSMGVLLLMLYYGIKIKSPGGFVKELFTAPFHAHGIGAQATQHTNLGGSLIRRTGQSDVDAFL